MNSEKIIDFLFWVLRIAMGIVFVGSVGLAIYYAYFEGAI